MDIKDVLIRNYLPYAKGTIIGRAIPSIDGLKPSQRRILYTMFKMGLVNGNKTKTSNIIGQSMRVHPHGDASINDVIIRMSTGNEALNTPYVEGKGNFGKVYSSGLACAAPRYTEAKLSKICTEVFDGIDEDAVQMIDNFDSTMLEPTLLPVKFPSILVNPSNGIAVGMSSSIPSFSIKNVCQATIDMLRGKVTDARELMQVLGVPEYSTGGYIHADEASLTKLGETGKGSFVMSGSVTTYPDKIIITNIPYRTTAEAIVEAIEEKVKSGELKEVTDVSDEIDLKGFRLVVLLRRGSNVGAVLQKLCRMTPLRMSISFNTRVIIGDRCEEIGLLDLLNKWIEFRVTTINRIYNHRLKVDTTKEHLLSAWEKIKANVKEVAQLIVSKNESGVKEELMTRYLLDSTQVEYLLDMKIKQFTQDNLNKRLTELNNIRNCIAEYNMILGSDNEKYKIIINDLTRIIANYGSDNKTGKADLIVEVADQVEEEKVDDTLVKVIVTKSGYIKRLVTLKDLSSYSLPDGEEELYNWTVKNNEDILVFTYDGTVHKILVNSIDAGRGGFKDEVYKLVGLPNKKHILLVDVSGDYSKYFNLVYPNGRGTRVYYSKAQGSRRKYKSLFEACEPGKAWITFSDQFFMITAKRKAAYCNLGLMGMGSRVAFKVARVSNGDAIWALQPADKVPDISLIDIERYHKDYTVCINDDMLWEDTSRKTSEDTDETNDTNSEVENE